MDERDNVSEENGTMVESISGTELLSKFFGTAREVVARYTHCGLCGANLHFTHVTDFSRNLTQETAKCPECGIKSQQSVHRLQ